MERGHLLQHGAEDEMNKRLLCAAYVSVERCYLPGGELAYVGKLYQPQLGRQVLQHFMCTAHRVVNKLKTQPQMNLTPRHIILLSHIYKITTLSDPGDHSQMPEG